MQRIPFLVASDSLFFGDGIMEDEPRVTQVGVLYASRKKYNLCDLCDGNPSTCKGIAHPATVFLPNTGKVIVCAEWHKTPRNQFILGNYLKAVELIKKRLPAILGFIVALVFMFLFRW